jgi:subtilisin family serine protease
MTETHTSAKQLPLARAAAIDAVAAELTAQEIALLETMDGIRVHENAAVKTNSWGDWSRWRSWSSNTSSSDRDSDNDDDDDDDSDRDDHDRVAERSAAAVEPQPPVAAAQDSAATTSGNSGVGFLRALLGGLNTDAPPAVSFTKVVNADSVHADGVNGKGITVAVLDSGFSMIDGLERNAGKSYRVKGAYDAQRQTSWIMPSDPMGHGTHVTSIIMNSDKGEDGKATGMAPGSDLVFIKAFDSEGRGSYVDVITGLDWLLDNHEKYGVRVLNLSFSAAPQSHYWDDPINQTAMKLWDAGIVVVASAGNEGPSPMSIGVPGNNPYVITVGAMTDNYTADPSDDKMASFSSAGPTHEGFVKPEIVAPGGHIKGIMPAS